MSERGVGGLGGTHLPRGRDPSVGLPVLFSDIDLAYLIDPAPDGEMVYTAGVFWRGQTFAGDPAGLAVLAYETS